MPLGTPTSARMSNPGAEWIAPLVSLWDRHGRVILGIAAGLLVLGVIGFFTLRARATAEEQAAGALAEASILYWQNDYQRSIQMARQTAEQFASTPSGVDARRLSGDAAYWMGDFKTAVAEYRRYLALRPKGVLSDAARRSLAYALESDKQFVEAAKEYEAVVGRFDRATSGEVLLSAARCYRLAGQPGEAIARLERLTGEFGEAPAASQGLIELAELRAGNPQAAAR